MNTPQTKTHMSRQTFAATQTHMTNNWFSQVQRNNADPDSYIKKRHSAYLDRWKEALRFVPTGSRILDIGGGNPFSGLFDLLKSHGLDYWYLDVDEQAVAGGVRLAQGHNFDPSHFSVGFNDQLTYETSFFDAVFSSHCIEHSFDLNTTLAEINRVLKPGGKLLMAVPLGWEENPAHPYFFAPDQWIALVEDSGFEIRVAQVGREYPENGYDLFLAAAKLSKPIYSTRFDPAAYCKIGLDFVGVQSETIS